MTPLAHRIVKELTLLAKRRTFEDHGDLLPHMADIHCFELSEVEEEIDALADCISRRPGSSDLLAFLPAPKTWLEFKSDTGRLGVLLEETNFGADFTYAYAHDGMFASIKRGQIALRQTLRGYGSDEVIFRYDDESGRKGQHFVANSIYAALALINTPRIFGRRQHLPHRGLQRDLVRARTSVGKFPLHAWTEIKLEITDPRETKSGNPSTAAHYTGERARHFCRTHLRIRLGKVELVPCHWRGNELLGIKQSRYRLTSKSKEEYVS